MKKILIHLKLGLQRFENPSNQLHDAVSTSLNILMGHEYAWKRKYFNPSTEIHTLSSVGSTKAQSMTIKKVKSVSKPVQHVQKSSPKDMFYELKAKM